MSEDQASPIAEKQWYKTPVGKLILLILWPFSLTYWVWKKNWNQQTKIGVIAGIWIFLTVIGATRQTGYKAPKEPLKNDNTLSTSPSFGLPKTTTAAEVTLKPTEIPTSTPIPKSKDEVVIDQLWQAIDKVFEGREGKDVKYDLHDEEVSVAYGEKSTFWDESSMVEGLFAGFVEYGKQVFSIDGVNNLRMTIRQEFTDSYGKNSVEDAASISMSKDEFQKYDWDSLRFQPIYYQMQRSATELYIHPGILTKIDVSKLKLKY